MATRNIKDAKDLTTNELIYFKGHAKATYMSDGRTVEDAINNIDLSEYATKEELNDKQDTINDLDTIRSGASLGATALQTETYKGTITGVSANGTSVATSGIANIPAASTSSYGVTKLSSATNSTSTTLAATASAVKSAYDLANGRQEKLVSGTNVKTINGESILGEGDINISSGTLDANVQAVDTSETLEGVETNTYVKYVAQTLTDSQKAQVRTNIGVDLSSYATTEYVDTQIGDINTVLTSIINQ